MTDDDWATAQFIRRRLREGATQTEIASELELSGTSALGHRARAMGLRFQTFLLDIRTGRTFDELADSGDLIPASAAEPAEVAVG